MKGHIPLKHSLKQAAGILAALSSPLVSRRRPCSGVVVLMYHRVADTGCFDSTVDDWNVTPRRFDRHMAWLSQNAECLTLEQFASDGQSSAGAKPRVLVTFDDGFGNFATQALPVLERYQIPATVFLVTGLVGAEHPYPFDRWSERNRTRTSRDSWVPITWDQVTRCIESGLVTFGSHSHTHPNPANLSAEELTQEAVNSHGALQEQLGNGHAFSYAYPYGSTRLGHVNSHYKKAVQDAGFTLGFSTDLGIAGPETDHFALPRIEVHSWDNPAIVGAKARGVLWPFRMTDALRGAK